MKRIVLSAAALAFLAFTVPAHPAQASVSVGVSVNTGGPYRGLSLSFRSQPDLALIPRSRVYYARDIDQDLYRYGNDWYYTQDDCWYASRSYRGPFVQIDVSSVPRDVFNVPTRYRRHWGGASHAPAYGYQDGNWNGNRNWGNSGQGNWDRTSSRYGNGGRDQGQNWGNNGNRGGANDRGQTRNRRGGQNRNQRGGGNQNRGGGGYGR